VGISVQVQEAGGKVVAQLDDLVDVGRMCAAATDESRFPLLSSVDPLDATYFNARQARRLGRELKSLRDDTADPVRAAAGAILRLAMLLEPGSGRPRRRQLVFVGD
jgi:hypothetical protein